MSTLVFYLFAFLMVAGGLMVISSRNPVHSVLYLIFCFFNASGLFLMLGAEFIAMALVIVYVGAVAVLFLFVVMMMNIKIAEVKQGFLKTLPLGVFLGALIFAQIYYALTISTDSLPLASEATSELTNTVQLGSVLYTDYFLIFQLAGMILFVAMVGAIVLTLTHSKKVRRQNIGKQIARTKEQTLSLVDAEFGAGVKL